MTKLNCKPCMAGNCQNCVDDNCLCREFHSKNKKRDLTDSINDIIDQLDNSAQKRKDEREKRIEKFGSVIKQIEDYCNTQVKDDPILVKQLLRVYFSAYTKDPINMAILAPSSDGKTHATVQVSKIFPETDFITVGRMSPTALIHQHGILVDENNHPIEEKLERLQQIRQTSKNSEEISEAQQAIKEILRTAKNLVDLNNKVLLFLDNPNPQTYEVLKPILSHDKEEILFKTTKGDGSLKVKETVIRGWPATIICSAKNEAKNEVWPEIETRFFMTSPNSSISKYKKANQLTAKKLGLPSWASNAYDNQEDKKWCIHYVSEIITQLKNQKDIWSPLHGLIAEYFPSNQGVTMRHIRRLLSFCNVETLINADEKRAYISFKNNDGKIIKSWVGTLKDLLSTIDIMGDISTVSPEKLKFFDRVFMPCFKEKNTTQDKLSDELTLLGKQGVLSDELAEKYTEVFEKPTNSKKIVENYLNPLSDEGLIQWEKDPDNQRRHIYFPSQGITIHNLQDLKSTIIDNSTITKNIYDYIILCLKEILQSSIHFRKSNVIFIKDRKVLNLDELISEIIRQ